VSHKRPFSGHSSPPLPNNEFMLSNPFQNSYEIKVSILSNVNEFCTLGAIRSGNFLRADCWDKPLEAVAVGRKRGRVVTYAVPVRVVSQDTPAPPVGGVGFLPTSSFCYTQKPVKLNRRD